MQQENAFKNKQKYTSPEDTELKSGHIWIYDKYFLWQTTKSGSAIGGISTILLYIVIFIGSAHRRRKCEGSSPNSLRPISYFGSIWELCVLDLKTKVFYRKKNLLRLPMDKRLTVPKYCKQFGRKYPKCLKKVQVNLSAQAQNL